MAEDEGLEIGELFKLVGDDGTGEEALDLMSRFVGDANGSMEGRFGKLGTVTVFAAGDREVSIFTREKDEQLAFYALALQKHEAEYIAFLYTGILRTPREEYPKTIALLKDAFESAFKCTFTVEERAPGTVTSFRVEAAEAPKAKKVVDREKLPATGFIKLDELK